MSALASALTPLSSRTGPLGHGSRPLADRSVLLEVGSLHLELGGLVLPLHRGPLKISQTGNTGLDLAVLVGGPRPANLLAIRPHSNGDVCGAALNSQNPSDQLAPVQGQAELRPEARFKILPLQSPQSPDQELQSSSSRRGDALAPRGRRGSPDKKRGRFLKEVRSRIRGGK